jgi:hypothetical protein
VGHRHERVHAVHGVGRARRRLDPAARVIRVADAGDLLGQGRRRPRLHDDPDQHHCDERHRQCDRQHETYVEGGRRWRALPQGRWQRAQPRRAEERPRGPARHVGERWPAIREVHAPSAGNKTSSDVRRLAAGGEDVTQRVVADGRDDLDATARARVGHQVRHPRTRALRVAVVVSTLELVERIEVQRIHESLEVVQPQDMTAPGSIPWDAEQVGRAAERTGQPRRVLRNDQRGVWIDPPQRLRGRAGLADAGRPDDQDDVRLFQGRVELAIPRPRAVLAERPATGAHLGAHAEVEWARLTDTGRRPHGQCAVKLGRPLVARRVVAHERCHPLQDKAEGSGARDERNRGESAQIVEWARLQYGEHDAPQQRAPDQQLPRGRRSRRHRRRNAGRRHAGDSAACAFDAAALQRFGNASRRNPLPLAQCGSPSV